jgi:tyrosine-protein kinase Etk/Wzc
MEETEKIPQKLPNQEFDYLKIGKILLSRWYWIASAVIIAYIGAAIYLWYTPKTYATQATVKLEDKRTDITDLLGAATSTEKTQSRIQSETYVLQSRSLLLNAIRDLNYPVSFYIEGRVRTKELYPQKAVDIKILRFDTLDYYRGIITYQPAANGYFSLTYNLNGLEVKKTFRYDEPVSIASTSFIINPKGGDKTTYLFKFNGPDEFLGRIKGGLAINEVVKNSGILSLRQTDANPEFAADALNATMNEYLVYDRIQKQQSAGRVISFIDNQLDTISSQVRRSEKAIEEYKQKYRLMDVSSAALPQVAKAADLESQRSLLKIQLKAIEDFKQQVIKEKDDVSLSFNMEGNADPSSGALVVNFNTLLNNKNSLLKIYNNNSPAIKDINHQLATAKAAILANVNLSLNNVNQKISYLESQLLQVNKQISAFPVAERELASLNRDFEINEKVYTFLSEKKLDAQISRSAIGAGASIVEKAQPNFGPVAPDERNIKRTAILLGLAVGLGSIVLIRILNPYIYDKETVESLTTIPIVGVIRKFPHKLDDDANDILVLSQPKSIFAESVRSVRTNLSFLAAEKENKVICITSEVAGEGKSFVAANLSSTLSLIDKKVILIAADLRRSKLHKTFHVPNDTGLSTFLAHQASMDDIIVHTSQENFDFIPSGPVPPNPSELLHTENMKLLINTLKSRYDIVMIDTAPVGLVSDSIPLIRLSDINVFVIRSGKSKFYSATIPQRIDQEYHLNNSVIILNAFEEDLLHSRYYTTKFTGDNYGARYYYYSDYVGYESSGYYLDSNKKKWWNIRRWFK